MAFHLRQIKIRPAAALEQLGGVVKEIQTEIEQAAGNRLAIHEHMLLRQMPAARTHEQRRSLRLELVLLAVWIAERNRSTHRIAQIQLAFDEIFPSRRSRVLKVRHENLRARIEC